MPKVQIPPADAKDSKKVVEYIQKAVQSHLASGGAGGTGGTGAKTEAASQGIYVKW
jgi:hypothetical protein